MTDSPAKNLMNPGTKYWFWSGDGHDDPAHAELLTLEIILPDTHSLKYKTDSGRFDYASFTRPTHDKIFLVKLIKTVSYDDQGNEIDLDEPILKLEAEIHATNGLHLWDRLWLNFSAAVKSADTMDSGTLSEMPLFMYNKPSVPTQI